MPCLPGGGRSAVAEVGERQVALHARGKGVPQLKGDDPQAEQVHLSPEATVSPVCFELQWLHFGLNQAMGFTAPIICTS